MRWALIVALVLGVPSMVGAQSTPSLHWDLYPNTSPADMVSLYRYRLTIDGTPTMLIPTCVTECEAPLAVSFEVGSVHALRFEIACAATPTFFGTPTTVTVTWSAEGAVLFPNVLQPGPNPCLPVEGPPPPTNVRLLRPCNYTPPAGGVVEQRPIGQMMQGFNPIGASGVVNNQADRIRVLKSWGWAVTLAQFVHTDTDRLFLIVECKGL